MSNGKISVITATNPAIQGKTFSLDEGKLVKVTAGNIVTGRVEVVEFGDVHEFAEILQNIRHDQVISSSVPKNGRQSAPLVTKEMRASNPDAIARSNTDFELTPGQRGEICIDYDPPSAGAALSRDELWALLCSVVPGIAQASVLWWCSGSSFIYEGERELQGLRGQRFYILVSDIADTERFGAVLTKRLWLAGLGHVEVSKSGSLNLRTIVDSAMFQVARVDYAGGSFCKPPLEQRRPVPIVQSDGGWFDTRACKDLNSEEERTYSHLVADAKAKAEPEAKAKRAAWEAAKLAAGVERLVKEGTPEKQAKERTERTLKSALAGKLTGNFEIILDDGEVCTVADILANREHYHGRACRDPLEPDYLNNKIVGHLNLDANPNLFSHAHGGAVYQLLATDSRSFDDWQESVIEAAGNVSELIEIAKAIDADPELSKSECAALLKGCAKASNVSLQVLRTDLRQRDERNDTRPVIRVKRNDFAGSVDECANVLPAIPTLRQRSGQLVEVVANEHGAACIQEVNSIRLGYLTAKVARWNYGDSDGAPDNSVLLAVLGAGNWQGVPRISGLLHQPTINLETGELISGSGFVPSLGREAVFSPIAYPVYQGADALKLLRGLLKEFPFVDGRSEAAALAAILTAAIRPSLSTAPGFMVTATDISSGKTCLSELIGAFAGINEVQHWPFRSEEQAKVLFSLLLEGRPGVIFDNLSSDWKSDAMAKILTGTTVSDRVLGASNTPTLSTACLFIANGLNVRPSADLVRRVLTIELDTGLERPWEKEFTFDPLAEVRANRGKWLMIALSVLSDYIQGGSRVELSPFGSFEVWSKTVRGALVAAGLPDPLQALAANHEADDDERGQLSRLLWFWQQALQGEGYTLRELVKLIGSATGDTPEAGLRGVLEEVGGDHEGINVRLLAAWFKRQRGKIVDRTRLVIADQSKWGAIWVVQNT